MDEFIDGSLAGSSTKLASSSGTTCAVPRASLGAKQASSGGLSPVSHLSHAAFVTGIRVIPVVVRGIFRGVRPRIDMVPSAKFITAPRLARSVMDKRGQYCFRVGPKSGK